MRYRPCLILLALLCVTACCGGCALREPINQDQIDAYQAQLDEYQDVATGLREDLAGLQERYDALKAGVLDRVKELTAQLGAEQAAAVIAEAKAKADVLVPQIAANARHLETVEATLQQMRDDPPEPGTPLWLAILQGVGTAAAGLALGAGAVGAKAAPYIQGFREVVRGVQRVRSDAAGKPVAIADIDRTLDATQTPRTQSLVARTKDTAHLKRLG